MCLCVYLCLSISISLTILNFFLDCDKFFHHPGLCFLMSLPSSVYMWNITLLNSVHVLSPLWSLLPQIQWIFLFVYPVVLVNTSVMLDCLFINMLFSPYEASLIEVRGHVIFIAMFRIYFQQWLTHKGYSINICQILFVGIKEKNSLAEMFRKIIRPYSLIPLTENSQVYPADDLNAS